MKSKIISDTVDRLSQSETYSFLFHKHRRGGGPMPSTDDLGSIVDLCRAVIFPGYYGNATIDSNLLKYHIGINTERLYELLKRQIHAGLCFIDDNGDNDDTMTMARQRAISDNLAAEFIEWLPQLRHILAGDVESMYIGDPAAKSFGEIISCYPSVRAVSSYRIAHKLLTMGVPLIPRIITELAHGETGIDIHPGADIGSNFTIDHGTGVVIGETCIIGNNVKLYQGVTLGAKSFPLDCDGNPIKNIPRHPVLEDDVVVYANATLLGRITIGRGAVIGGNVWLTHSVDPGQTVVQA